MRELNFVRDQKLQEAWQDVQWNFLEDVEKAVEDQVSYILNKVLRIEADQQLCADPFERTLARVDYRAGYRRRSLITPKGTYWLQVPKARSTPLRFSVFDRYRRLWKRVDANGRSPGSAPGYRGERADGLSRRKRTHPSGRVVP
jgi:transposase-like protein